MLRRLLTYDCFTYTTQPACTSAFATLDTRRLAFIDDVKMERKWYGIVMLSDFLRDMFSDSSVMVTVLYGFFIGSHDTKVDPLTKNFWWDEHTPAL